METGIDYLSLIEQKAKLLSKLDNLDAEEFAAMSLGEMNEIERKRRDVKAAIKSIDKLINNA